MIDRRTGPTPPRAAATQATPPEVRKLRQALHKKRLRDAQAAARRNGPVLDPKALDRSKYFPHQGEREIPRVPDVERVAPHVDA